MMLKDVSDKSLVPVMADESCCDHHDAERLASLRACPMFNIKLGKSSGILNAMKISALAERHGIQLQAGGFLETRLGFTATAHVALACSNIIHFDLDSPLFMTEDPVEGGMIYRPGGRVEIPESYGLGAIPDSSFLKNLESVKIS
jgi:L-alanine-DL-glutamate epimerase-like enolase superfamily enzyme